MRKIGMVVAAAAVVSYAGAARAQTTEQIIEATATIESVMNLEETQGIFDCGTVSGFGVVDTDCTGPASASVRVTANQNWVLTVEDLFQVGAECLTAVDNNTGAPSEAGFDKVTLCNNDDGANGVFVVSLDYTSPTCDEATEDGTEDTIAGTSAEDCDVDIVTDDDAASIAGLDAADGFGVYAGSFSVTLSAAP